jgi:hypothetical protein
VPNALERFDAMMASFTDWETRDTAARWDPTHGWHHPLEAFSDRVVFIPRWLQ